VRYTGTGELAWERLISDDPSEPLTSRDLAALPDGRVIQLGYHSFPDGRPSRSFLTAFTPSGDLLWSVELDPPITLEGQHLSALEVTPAGEVVVLMSAGENKLGHVAVEKLDAEGHTLWRQTLEPIWSDRLSASALDIGRSGEIVIAGRESLSSSSWVAQVLKLDPNGHLVWRTAHDSQPFNLAFSKVELGATGEVYVAGYESSVYARTAVVFKLGGSDGVVEWSRQLAGGSSPYDYLSDLTTAWNGDLYLLGRSSSSVRPSAIGFLIALRPDGTTVSKDEYTGPTGEGAIFDALVAAGDQVIAIGSAIRGLEMWDLVLVGYGSDSPTEGGGSSETSWRRGSGRQR
jgi:outer membrane protein assembly factor BamB